MPIRLLPLLLALCAAPALACLPPPKSTPVPYAGDHARAAEVWKSFESWLDAYSHGELEPVMAIFAPEVVFSFQGVADQGVEQLRASYVDDFRTRKPGVVWRPQVEEVYADGNLAFVRARWERVELTPGVEERIVAVNRSIDVLRREPDGAWRIIRSMNYPEKN